MRRYLTARALGLLLVAGLLIAVMTALGLWQLDAYGDQQRNDARAALQRQPVGLDEALGPDEAFPAESVGRPVTASGSYAGVEQFYVRGFDGADGDYAVVTPLVTGSGSAVLVLRGAGAAPAAPPPGGRVAIEGILEPSQAAGAALDASRVTDGIRISTLVPDVDQDLYAGFVILRTSDPADGLPPIEAPAAQPSRWAGVRNLLYAVQWWVFAGFVAFMWWRIVSDAEAPTSQPVR